MMVWTRPHKRLTARVPVELYEQIKRQAGSRDINTYLQSLFEEAAIKPEDYLEAKS